METLRSFTVTVELDTNKRTEQATFLLDDYDNTDQVLAALREWTDDLIDEMS